MTEEGEWELYPNGIVIHRCKKGNGWGYKLRENDDCCRACPTVMVPPLIELARKVL